jgi:hypothetical protein
VSCAEAAVLWCGRQVFPWFYLPAGSAGGSRRVRQACRRREAMWSSRRRGTTIWRCGSRSGRGTRLRTCTTTRRTERRTEAVRTVLTPSKAATARQRGACGLCGPTRRVGLAADTPRRSPTQPNRRPLLHSQSAGPTARVKAKPLRGCLRPAMTRTAPPSNQAATSGTAQNWCPRSRATLPTPITKQTGSPEVFPSSLTR